ncbi:hypothetical protein GOP47_0016086, partial [Adiantum capillus-veneris]
MIRGTKLLRIALVTFSHSVQLKVFTGGGRNLLKKDVGPASLSGEGEEREAERHQGLEEGGQLRAERGDTRSGFLRALVHAVDSLPQIRSCSLICMSWSGDGGVDGGGGGAPPGPG